MIQDVLQEIGGIGLYGVVSISLFFVVFGGALLWACRLKTRFLDTMGALPLDDEAGAAPARPEGVAPPRPHAPASMNFESPRL